jgi:hypothetical protein
MAETNSHSSLSGNVSLMPDAGKAWIGAVANDRAIDASFAAAGAGDEESYYSALDAGHNPRVVDEAFADLHAQDPEVVAYRKFLGGLLEHADSDSNVGVLLGDLERVARQEGGDDPTGVRGEQLAGLVGVIEIVLQHPDFLDAIRNNPAPWHKRRK